MENKVTSHIVKGAILSAFGILISIIVTVFNLYEVSWINYINYTITIGGLIYSCIMYANENNNNVTFGNIFAHGFKTDIPKLLSLGVISFLQPTPSSFAFLMLPHK